MPETQPYLTLKLAHELYRKAPERLAPAERQRLDNVVARQMKIEQRILATPDAAQVVLPVSSVDRPLAEIRQRYDSETEFAADLEKSGLSPAALRAAIERDLTVEAVLERVASQTAAVTETDVEIFYLTHRERFLRPASRTLRHILITVNESLAGNERDAVRIRIDEIRARLQKSPERFAEQALKHSECPTAMNGGLLGAVTRGQLYAEIEPAAFALRSGELSAVVESPMGFHVIFCEAIETPAELPLASVRDKVRTHLEDTRRRTAQKSWIAGLFARGA
ncbi:MAG: nitrogen fixation protein NifM [Rhodocyclaceae bacterium]|nr:nitrogen fixation protein NifM [Rhodocyclaceae bacterium]